MRSIGRRLPAAAVTLFVFPVIAADYFRPDTGREYGVGLSQKLLLLVRMIRTNLRVTSATSFITHTLIAAEVMKVPRSIEGDLVECGAYKGGSTANLSLIAQAVGRKLHVFDSFGGLPEPEAVDKGHVVLGERRVRTYQAGDYCGTLSEVGANLRRFGALESTEFHVGLFEKTMPSFGEPTVMIFVDVDLLRSEETCLMNLWPLLQPDCTLFCDEAQHHEIAQLFYDREWWREHLDTSPPGLVGAGNGIGLFLAPGGFRSSLGWTAKIDRDSLKRLPG